MIKEQALSLSDLDALWAAQAGKHDAIVKNVHDLLAKLAWDFSPEQLDHLFECFHVINYNYTQLTKINQSFFITRFRLIGLMLIRNKGRNYWN